jgi:hypothetical protein
MGGARELHEHFQLVIQQLLVPYPFIISPWMRNSNLPRSFQLKHPKGTTLGEFFVDFMVTHSLSWFDPISLLQGQNQEPNLSLKWRSSENITFFHSYTLQCSGPENSSLCSHILLLERSFLAIFLEGRPSLALQTCWIVLTFTPFSSGINMLELLGCNGGVAVKLLPHAPPEMPTFQSSVVALFSPVGQGLLTRVLTTTDKAAECSSLHRPPSI